MMSPVDSPILPVVAQRVGRAAAVVPEAERAVEVSRVSSRDLLGDGREVEIEHEGMLYRLRVTALNKLILTK